MFALNQKFSLYDPPVRMALDIPSKEKRKKKKLKENTAKVSLMRVRRRRVLSRDSTTLIVYYRMIAPRHTRMRLGERGFCVAALYAISPPSHFGETPLFRIDPFNLTLVPVSLPRAGLNCARGKAFSPFAVFREILFRETLFRINTIDLDSPLRLISALPSFSPRLRSYELIIC